MLLLGFPAQRSTSRLASTFKLINVLAVVPKLAKDYLLTSNLGGSHETSVVVINIPTLVERSQNCFEDEVRLVPLANIAKALYGRQDSSVLLVAAKIAIAPR